MSALILVAPLCAYGFELDDPDFTFDEVIFEYKGETGVFSPRARKAAGPALSPHGTPPAWYQSDGNAYAEFDPAEVFPEGGGSMEIEVVVLEMEALDGLEDWHESLVTIYDREDVAFFSVGINAHEASVGSHPLYPEVMEDVFGGVRFPYGQAVGSPLQAGTHFRVCVQWGPETSDNRVYINGKRVISDTGGEPAVTLEEFMHGFPVRGGEMEAGPPYSFVVGRKGLPDGADPLGREPRAFGILRVYITNFPLYQ